MSRIFIVGSGTVGSATGLDLIRAGHQVTFVDDADTRVAALTEQGLELLRRHSVNGASFGRVLERAAVRIGAPKR